MTEFGKCHGGGRRSAPREAAPLIGVFTTVTRSHAAFVVDVSRTGARLRGDDLPATGDELLLSIEHVRAFGIVAWAHDGECGVAFEAPLPPDEVLALRSRVARGAGLTPEIRAAMDDWTVGLAR